MPSAPHPPLAELDGAAPDHAVIFRTGPDAFFNTRALKLSGIERDFQVSDGGSGFAEKDASGQPTGPAQPQPATSKRPRQSPRRPRSTIPGCGSCAGYNSIGIEASATAIPAVRRSSSIDGSGNPARGQRKVGCSRSIGSLGAIEKIEAALFIPEGRLLPLVRSAVKSGLRIPKELSCHRLPRNLLQPQSPPQLPRLPMPSSLPRPLLPKPQTLAKPTKQIAALNASTFRGKTNQPLHPFIGIATAVTWRARWFEGELHSEETFSREQALRFYTINNGRLLFRDDQTGSLESRKLADFAVLDTDLLMLLGGKNRRHANIAHLSRREAGLPS